MKMNVVTSKMDSNLTGLWVNFFTAAGIPSEVAATYALTFTENRIQNDMLLDLNKEYLRDMGIMRMGDIIAILRHAKQVHENTARDRVLNTTAVSAKVPVAAVTGRSTATPPTSAASRILEHYTRRSAQTDESSPVRPAQQKRKSAEMVSDELSIKKARLIRFGSPPASPAVKEAIINKNVFSRLGNSEPVKVKVVQKPAKQIYTRLGLKDPQTGTEPTIPVQRDALKYEGILKNEPVIKKGFTITTTSNNARKIACTMRADEQPVSVKDKLAAKNKSVKFSNHIQYKEIEATKKVVVGKPKVTQVFNKPERRLSMPETGPGVKGRLGVKNQDQSTISIGRNIFNRLVIPAPVPFAPEQQCTITLTSETTPEEFEHKELYYYQMFIS